VDIKIKQRIVGTAVLTSLSVIFLPMLLDGKTRHKVVMESSLIPEKSVKISVKKTPELQVKQTTPIDQQLQAKNFWKETNKTVSVEKKKVKKVVSTKKPKTKNQLLAKTKKSFKKSPSIKLKTKKWVVQAGSYKHEVNAAYFRKKLLAKKYPALIEKVERKSGLHYRVRLGPLKNYTAAKKFKVKLARDFKVKGWVAQY
jgi:cell division septation protein DedD